MYLLSMILLIFFAIIGLCAFINAVINAAHSSADDEVLIVLRELEENSAEARIRKAARMYMNAKGARLVCVCDSDVPEIKICEMMSREYPFMEIISKQEARKIFQ